MNTFVGTASTTFHTLQTSSKVGLQEGNVPTTLQKPHASKQTCGSTVIAFTLAAMFGTGLASQELPPTFVDTAGIITPTRIIERKGLALFGYKIDQLQEAAVNEYLRQHVTSRVFLSEVAAIVDDIYGTKVIRDLHVVEDEDTGMPIMELTVLSGLPLDDEFDQKDQSLFQKIEASGLAWCLRDVVISQG